MYVLELLQEKVVNTTKLLVFNALYSILNVFEIYFLRNDVFMFCYSKYKGVNKQIKELLVSHLIRAFCFMNSSR